jgi:serine/threonine protein kinase/uncharacterized protein YecT (DUF1311 family)
MFPADADFPSDLRALEREYELIRELGQGGMAAVYLARRRDDGRLVAIKAIRARYLDDPDALQRFTREAATVAGLDHPNIVRTESIEQIGDRAVAIIMEHVPGGTVRDYLREHGSLGAEHVETILRDVATALGYAHRRGIVHRDVKPENVFLDTETGRALLSDFGIARRIDGDAGITLLGAALGTPQYMSPEQIDGQLVDGRSDIYSLGVLGWELLTGRRPWAGESLYGVIYKQKHEDLPRITSLRPRVPANLLFAIEGALIKDKKLRWQTTDEFLDQLTYNPPPVLAQTFPPGAPPGAPRVDDHPTVRFRKLALVESEDGPAVDARMDDGGLAEPGLVGDASSPIRTASPPLPIAQFVANDDVLRDSGERPAAPVAVTGSDFTLPAFEPNADAPFEFSSRRSQLLRALGLVLPLGIAGSALFIVLSGSAADSARRASRATSETSGGSIASDSALSRPVSASADPGATLAAKPPNVDDEIVAGGSTSAEPVSATPPAPPPARRPNPRSSHSRSGVAAATGPSAQPSVGGGGVLARAAQTPAETVDTHTAPAEDDAASSRAVAVLEDPFKIPPRSGAGASAPALGTAPLGPSPRCRIAATADQRACLDAYIAIGDAPLTQAFDALVAELRRLAATPPGAPDPPTVQRVRVEQRAWLSVRNQECPRAPAAGAEPFWAEAQSQCFTEMAASRTAELRDAVRRLKRK